MKKFDEIQKSTSCLNKASLDEPVFVLRAHDELASDVVRSWAMRYHKKHNQAGTLNFTRRHKFAEAMTLADEMDEWKRENPY